MWRSRRTRLYMTRLILVLSAIFTMGFMWLMVSVADVWAHSYNGSENNWNMFMMCESVRNT